MNNNAPLEASNLNNPSPKLRNSLRGVDCLNKTEIINIDDLEPDIWSYNRQPPVACGSRIENPTNHMSSNCPGRRAS